MYPISCSDCQCRSRTFAVPWPGTSKLKVQEGVTCMRDKKVLRQNISRSSCQTTAPHLYAGRVFVSVGASAVSSTMHMSETKARRMNIFSFWCMISNLSFSFSNRLLQETHMLIAASFGYSVRGQAGGGTIYRAVFAIALAAACTPSLLTRCTSSQEPGWHNDGLRSVAVEWSLLCHVKYSTLIIELTNN